MPRWRALAVSLHQSLTDKHSVCWRSSAVVSLILWSPRDGNRTCLRINFTNEMILIPKEREADVYWVAPEGGGDKDMVLRRIARDVHDDPVSTVSHERLSTWRGASETKRLFQRVCGPFSASKWLAAHISRSAADFNRVFRLLFGCTRN
jgi:hypothetical protein